MQKSCLPGKMSNRFICDQGKFRHVNMRSSILILILFLSFLLIPVVSAEDAVEWYTKGQDALKVGNYQAAITYFNNALMQDSKLAPAYAGRAAALNMQGKYAEAIDSADDALALKSMDPVALNARAYGFFRLGQYENAITAYDNLFIVEQNRKDAYCNQAYAYLLLNDTSAPALTAADRCTMLNSDDFMAWNNKGSVLMLAKKYDAALTAFDRATVITIKNATVWNNKGKALVAVGKPNDALECFNKALGIDPGFAEAKANKADAMGRQQSFTIAGTITPKETVSRIGTLFTIVTTPPKVATAVTEEPQAEATTEPAAPTKTTIPKKTTYAPISPVTVLFALAVIAGIASVMRRE